MNLKLNIYAALILVIFPCTIFSKNDDSDVLLNLLKKSNAVNLTSSNQVYGSLSAKLPNNYFYFIVNSNFSQIEINIQSDDYENDFDLYLAKNNFPYINLTNRQASTTDIETATLQKPDYGIYIISIMNNFGEGKFKLSLNWKPNKFEDTPYMIKNALTKYTIGRLDESDKARHFPYNKNESYHWYFEHKTNDFYMIINAVHDECLYFSKKNKYVELKKYDVGLHENFLWKFKKKGKKKYNIVHKTTIKQLDIDPDSSYVYCYTENGSDEKLWELIKITNYPSDK